MAPTKTKTKTKSKSVAPKAAKAPKPRMALAEVMAALKKAGSAQTKKTYMRHGGVEPMFGVSFATLKDLTKKIDVDHELALALWDSGNFDARNLAVKIVDPAKISAADLDRWARDTWSATRMCGGYVGMLAAETPHASKKLSQWLGSKVDEERGAGWSLLRQLAQRDETLPDSLFEKHLARIERTIHRAPNSERDGMNSAVIAIGARSSALRKAALAAAKRIGTVEIDHGDTACQTPDAADYIEKVWARATARGFDSPAAHERSMDVPRRRC